MGKIAKTMVRQGRFFLFLFIMIVSAPSLWAGGNTMSKAYVKNGDLNLFFSQRLNGRDIKHFTLYKPYREIYDFKNMRLAHSRVPLGLGNNVRIAQNSANSVRVVIESSSPYKPLTRISRGSYAISLPKGASIYTGNTSAPQTYARSGRHTEAIVIDAGHGGHDAGAIGGGKREKDVVLQIAKKTAQMFKDRGYPVYLTRSDDRFLRLDQRTKIADRKDAKVFISIHANAIGGAKMNAMQGIETFFLQNTRDARSQNIAARENAAVLKGTDRVSRNVIIDSVLNGPKIVESNKLAIDIHRHLMTNARAQYRDVRDGGVRHAPFYVLVGASRPSVLIEVGYISHRVERDRIFNQSYQSRLSRGIVDGVESYLKNRRKEIDF